MSIKSEITISYIDLCVCILSRSDAVSFPSALLCAKEREKEINQSIAET